MIESLLSMLRPDSERFFSVVFQAILSPWILAVCLMMFGLSVNQSRQKARLTFQPAMRRTRNMHNPQNRQIVFEAAQAVSSIKAFQERVSG